MNLKSQIIRCLGVAMVAAMSAADALASGSPGLGNLGSLWSWLFGGLFG